MANEKRTKYQVVGDTMIDLSKLIFGGIVLAGIFNSDVNKILLISAGFLFFAIFLAVGIYITTKK